MNSHSRSSSEVETLLYSDILPIYIEDFQKDFSFADVRENVKDIFSKHDYDDIMAEPNEKQQIIRLFWVLGRNESIIPKFLKSISGEYGWLADKVLSGKNAYISKAADEYLYARNVLRSNNHSHGDFNVHRMDAFMSLRRALKSVQPFKYVVLFGDLGTGKKWLAIDVCSEYTVMKAMDFKLYWIDVAQCNSPEEDLQMLQYLYIQLFGANEMPGNGSRSPTISSDNISNRILDKQQAIKRKLNTNEYKNCLLVLLNVQNVKTWKAFNLGCKILIITRNSKVYDSISPSKGQHINIADGLTKSEFYQLFENYLPYKRDKFPKNASDIYDYSNRHPYLLAIIAQNLTNETAWNRWIQNLKNLNIDNNKLTSVIELSLDVLEPHHLELYKTFAIFPNSTAVPIKLLSTLWHKTALETEDIVMKFHTYSFVKKIVKIDGTIVCSLPFIYSSYLKKQTSSPDELKELHNAVIAYYKVEEAINERTEIDMFNDQHDAYFYRYIGYHLRNADRSDIFPKLYFDFGFLEQKMRRVGLLSTIADLKDYEREIINNDCRRHEVLREIRDCFLPSIEEKILQSQDTCLMQYALMHNGAVHDEAQKQIQKFPTYVWFTESGNFHQRRQIFNLPCQAKMVDFLEEDICLIVLIDNSMILVDISLDCSTNPIHLINNNKTETAAIIDVLIFRNFMLSLDEQGALKLWSISDARRRSLIQRRGSTRQKANMLNTNSFTLERSRCKRSIQAVHETIKGKRGKIVAFDIEQSSGSTFLHVAFDTGDIALLHWNTKSEEFEQAKVPVLLSRFKSIRFLRKILKEYYMLLTKSGDINFWNLKDSSNVPFSFEWPKSATYLISCQVYEFVKPFNNNNSSNKEKSTHILFVFGDKVLCLRFGKQKFNVLDGVLETIYETDDIITCGKFSHDGRYLVLGTKHGIVVIDVNSKSEILRSHVSETIKCIDIYDLSDPIYKYMIICSSEHKKNLNILALRKVEDKDSLDWAHRLPTTSEQPINAPQLEPNVWLLGDNLYDINYDKYTYLVAVDSKYRIHQVCTTNTKNWSIITPQDTTNRITAITSYQQKVFVAFANGEIYNVNKESYESCDFAGEPINYLHLVDEHVLVASSSARTCIQHLTQLSDYTLKSYETVVAYKLFNAYLVLVNELGSVMILDIENNFAKSFYQEHLPEEDNINLGGCDLKDDSLFLATSSTIHIYKFARDEQHKLILLHYKYKQIQDEHARICCLAASHDTNLIAIGLKSGNIEIHKFIEQKLNFIYCLQSHAAPIYAMKFSPKNDVLVSCSEQLCYWSMSYVINNPLIANTTKRRSSRFSSQRSSDLEETDATITNMTRQHLCLDVAATTSVKVLTPLPAAINPWLNKHGPLVKPELLACIKFDGNKAKNIFTNADFTQFNTIDNEGAYYNLKLLLPQHAKHNTAVDKPIANAYATNDNGWNVFAADDNGSIHNESAEINGAINDYGRDDVDGSFYKG